MTLASWMPILMLATVVTQNRLHVLASVMRHAGVCHAASCNCQISDH